MRRTAGDADENPHLAPARVRAALRALDVRPSREMGQNFLVDATALATALLEERFAQAGLVRVEPGETPQAPLQFTAVAGAGVHPVG